MIFYLDGGRIDRVICDNLISWEIILRWGEASLSSHLGKISSAGTPRPTDQIKVRPVAGR